MLVTTMSQAVDAEPLFAPGMSGRKMYGFTLIELLVVVAILVILLGIAAPSFSEFLAGQRAKGLSYDLTSDMMLARNEALKRNAAVVISRGGTGWQEGWAVTTAATNEVLSRRDGGPVQGVTVTGAPATIRFDVNGRVAWPMAAVRITIASASTNRCVELDPSGRARALSGACT